MIAEILSFDSAGNAKVLETWSLQGDVAVCSDADAQAYMEEFGIVNPAKGKLFPKDGHLFIESLPIEFSGSRIRARLVEGGTCQPT